MLSLQDFHYFLFSDSISNRQRWPQTHMQQRWPFYACKKNTGEDTHKLMIKEGNVISKRTRKHAGLTILICDKIEFRPKLVRIYKVDSYWWKVGQEGSTVLNTCTKTLAHPRNRNTKYVNSKGIINRKARSQ